MNKIILNLLVLGLTVIVPSVSMAQISGKVEKVNIPYILPQTGIKVVLKVAHEKIEKGPYAKYSQQFLGVVAPLSDRESYTILSGSLSTYTEGDVSNIYVVSDATVTSLDVEGEDIKTENETKEYSKTAQINLPSFSDLSISPIVSVDKVTVSEKSVDEMARDAANTIFTLRKRRFDLITGESSENAFGAGLGAAIDEMKRIEDEYLSLFVGKKTTIIKDYIFDVVPKDGEANYVVCRFTKNIGIVDAMDVSGEPILLVVTPEGNVKEETVDYGKKVVKTVATLRVADMSTCKLFDNSLRLLETRRLPVLQFGAAIEVVSVK